MCALRPPRLPSVADAVPVLGVPPSLCIRHFFLGDAFYAKSMFASFSSTPQQQFASSGQAPSNARRSARHVLLMALLCCAELHATRDSEMRRTEPFACPMR